MPSRMPERVLSKCHKIDRTAQKMQNTCQKECPMMLDRMLERMSEYVPV